jgi:hypothetical protein
MPPSYYADKKGDTLTLAHINDLMSRGTLQDVKATIIQRCTRGLFARIIYRGLLADQVRRIAAQTAIGAPWRGGVVRMRNNKKDQEDPNWRKTQMEAMAAARGEGAEVKEEGGGAEVKEEGGGAEVKEEEGAVQKVDLGEGKEEGGAAEEKLEEKPEEKQEGDT